MKVLFINSVCGILSTGRICADLAEGFRTQGHQVKIGYGRGSLPERCREYGVKIGSDLGVRLSGVHTRLTDRHGFANRRATAKFLRWAEEFDPDLLWLHNLHGYYIDVEQLFQWIKSRPQMQVKWTLHDCWTFTGHCAHFTYARCDRWKTGCHHCPERKQYPAALRDNSRRNYLAKAETFTGVANMTLITPSRWLADLTRESFLREYPVEVCHNTIDETVFRPTDGAFRVQHGLEGKRLVLAVASAWGERKGLPDLIRLSEMLPENYAVVVVGLTPKQKESLPSPMVGITRTHNATELAHIYTTCDVFVNPTYEDTYPTVNLEAKACGTPVITYRTGGSVESVPEENVVEVGDFPALRDKILMLTGGSKDG